MTTLERLLDPTPTEQELLDIKDDADTVMAKLELDQRHRPYIEYLVSPVSHRVSIARQAVEACIGELCAPCQNHVPMCSGCAFCGPNTTPHHDDGHGTCHSIKLKERLAAIDAKHPTDRDAQRGAKEGE